MAIIRIMDEILANKIAAGEVVERCASVVKELVENSIDAKATEIKVELIDSGLKLIKVTDNGKGMEKQDALLCFSRHATSKIIDEDDLYRIHTLGFRGEALASIASVSNITLSTSTGDVGTIINIKGGKILNVESGDCRVGTIISVEELFYNTPARLKHLKSVYSELSFITDYMNKLSLSHPNIRFTLINNNKVLLKTDGSNNLLKTISDIYGVSIAKKMIEISDSDDDYEINGFISLPEIHRSNRNAIITIVNGRVVKNNELIKTINEAYHSYKPDNYYPIVVINIEVDTTLVDVNIHPTKMDIKFGKMEELLELVSSSIKNSLKPKTLIPNIDTKPFFIHEKEQKNNESYTNYEEITLDFDTVSDNQELYGELDIHPTIKEKLPMLDPVGLVHGTYIIAQNDIGMYIIDQHAAKERINYEICLKKLSTPCNKKIALTIPFTHEFSNSEFIILKENFEFIKLMGFDIEEFGINSVVIKSHPTWIPYNNEFNSIKKVLDIIIEKENKFNIEKFNDHLAATMACKMSIKANTNITLQEMHQLINDLRNCENPFNCPHGRPTVIYYSKYDMEKLFKRSGF